MNQSSRIWAVVSYITWIGWLIAYLKRDKGDALVRRHLNQAFILNVIASAAGLLGRIGGIFRTIYFVVDLAVLVMIVIGIIHASRGSDEPLPIIGNITLFD